MFLKKYKYYILSFIIPCLVILFALVCNFVFIKNDVFIGDLRSQYVSFFSYYQNLLMGKQSLLYSFQNGLGDSMIGTFSYYLASPLNLILLLFSTKNIGIGIIIIMILKLSLASLTMFIFLSKVFKNKNEKFTIIFAVSYALTMFSSEYFINVMWFDGLYLAPLLLLGIHNIVESKSSKLYAISLFLSIFTNYYIGFMLCIFSVIYFIYLMIKTYNKKTGKRLIKKIIIKYLITSILSAFCCCILLIPTLYQMMNTNKDVFNIFNNNTFTSINVFESINNIFIGRYDKIPYNKNVLIYSGMFTTIFLIFYFFNKNISKKEKILSIIVILIFILSFNFNILNYIWHGFSKPNGYVFRNIFLLLLFINILSFESFTKSKELEKKHYFIIITIITLLLLISQISIKFSQIDIMGFVSLFSVIIYLILVYIINNKQKFKSDNIKVLEVLLIVVVILELTLNFYLVFSKFTFNTKDEYQGFIYKYKKEIKQIKEKDKTPFFRTHVSRNYSSNDSYLLETNGLSSFNSTMNKNITDFYSKVAINQINQSINYKYGRNSFLDSILGVKYLILDKKEKYKKIDSFKFCRLTGLLYTENGFEDTNYLYKNTSSLSLGYMINDAVLEKNNQKKEEISGGLNYQNYMYNLFSSDDNDILYLMTNKVERRDENEYQITIENDKDIYTDMPVYFKNQDGEFKLYIDNKLESDYKQSTFSSIKIENKYKKGDKVNIKFEFPTNVIKVTEPKFFYYNADLVPKLYKKLSKNQLEITSFKDYDIKGTIKVDDNHVLFTTIPYDEGWSIYVDGKKMKSLKLYDVFLGTKLKNGEHKVEFKFFPKGLKEGIIISFISLILLILYLKFEKQIFKLDRDA